MVTTVMQKAFGWLLLLLTVEKARQDIHMDVASILALGQLIPLENRELFIT
jgi:hypothetical protein